MFVIMEAYRGHTEDDGGTMAWELQQHMHSYIAPSIYAAAQNEDDPKLWLARRYADQRWNAQADAADETGEDIVSGGADKAEYDALVADALGMPEDVLIDAIAEFAIEHGATTNGGWEVYLDGWTSIPFCSEDEKLAWNG
jgi:hypothetical protein